MQSTGFGRLGVACGPPRLKQADPQREDLLGGFQTWATAALCALALQVTGKGETGMPESVQAAWRIASFAEPAGIQHRLVANIAFTRDGNTWLAVSDGLYRYDGFAWSKYTTNHGLPSSFLRTVTTTRDGVLWIGTDRYAGTFDGRAFDARGTPEALPGPNVRRIVEVQDGSLWFCCDRWPDSNKPGGLGVRQDGKWRRYTTADGLPSDHLLDFIATSDGRRLALTSRGVAYQAGERWLPLADPGFPQDETIWSIVEARGGTLFAEGRRQTWVYRNGGWSPFPGKTFPICATADAEIFGIDPNRGDGTVAFTQWSGDTFGLASAAVPAMGAVARKVASAPDGAIWAVGQGLLLRWERLPVAWEQWSPLPPPRFKDRSGRVWFADPSSTGSVYRVDGKFENVPELSWPLVEDGAGGIWGRHRGGVARLAPRAPPDTSLAPRAIGAPNHGLADARGNPWFGRKDPDPSGRLWAFDGTAWRDMAPEVLTHLTVISAAADPDDGVWLSTVPRGATDILRVLHVAGDGVAREIQFTNRALSTHRPEIYADREYVWLSSYGGLFRAPRSRPQDMALLGGEASGGFGEGLTGESATLFRRLEGPDGRGGLVWWRSGRWHSWTLNNLGAFWTGADGALMASEEERVVLGQVAANDRLGGFSLPVKAATRHLLRENRGKFWLGTDAGTFSFRPSGRPPRTFIEAPDTQVRRDELWRVELRAVGWCQAEPLPPGTTLFSWRFDDGPWLAFQAFPAGGLSLRHLRPGPHRFEARARDAFGHVEGTAATMTLTVLPVPLQERPWFSSAILSLAAILAGLSYLVWHSRLRLAVHAASLESTVAERTARLQADIQRREKVEDDLRLSEERFRGVFNSTYQIMALLTADGRILEGNQALMETFGSRIQDIQGRFFWDGAWIPTSMETRERIQAAFGQAAQGQAVQFVTQLVGSSGKPMAVDLLIRQIHDAVGRVRFLILEAHDITVLEQAAADRLSLQQQLAQAQKMESVGRLAGGVAHDFNNLLTVILGNLELAHTSAAAEDAAARENLEECQRAAKRAAELTSQLLAFSRKQILEMKTVDLNQVILGFGKMLRRLIGEDIEVRTQLQPELGAVRADPAQMEQVLLNLAVNARDAMPKGGRLAIETNNIDLDRAYCERYPEVREGNWVLLIVSDTGCGMDLDTRNRLFEPFFTTKPAGKGTGLGLATVYGIVKQHDGHVNVYSEPGKGATFRIYLPRLAATEPEPESVKPAENKGGDETILVLEDDPAVRKLTCNLLTRKGYRILEAKEPAEGIALAAREARIDLLLSDVIMPGMSGQEAYLRIREKHPNIRVLFCSGYAGNVIEHHGILEDDLHFLQKPFTSASLTRKVRETLDLNTVRN